MRVVINALSLKARMGGGLVFGLNLSRLLAESRGAHEVLILGGEHNQGLLAQTGGQVVSLGRGLGHPLKRIVYEQTRLGRRISELKADLLLSLDGTLPRHLRSKSVAILQNLIYFHMDTLSRDTRVPTFSGLYARAQAAYFLRSWERTSRVADACLFVSQTAKGEFVRHFPRMADKAHVILEAISAGFERSAGPDLTEPYLLGVGTLYKHKRFDLLIDLFSRLRNVRGLRLKLAGPDWGGQMDRLREQARACGLADRVDFLGYCEHDDLIPLYQGALALAQFSETEAHPIPIAEASACGTPLIIVDRSGTAELGGDWAFKITDSGLDDAARFVRRLVDEPAFWRARSDLAWAGAHRFNRDTIANAYWTLFASVVGAGARPERIQVPPSVERDRLESAYKRLPRSLQTLAVNVAGLRNRRTRYGRVFWEELRYLEACDRFSEAELLQVQAERLGRLMRTAYEHVPYYRQLLDERRLSPADFREPADLIKLPVLEKATVAAQGERLVNQSLPKGARQVGRTSGSTGTSLRLVHDSNALAAEFATVWRLRRRFGSDLEGWHASFAGRLFVPVNQRRPPYHRINYVQRQALFSLYHLSAQTVPHFASALAEREFDFYTGYPSALEALVLAASEAGLRIPPPRTALFTSSESLLQWQKERLESSIGVPVHDRYGCAEFCVSFSVCEAGRYHLDSEFCVVEWEPLKEDATSVTGVLLCTGLMNHAMPFIRYRVGDVATLAKSPCPCGRASLSALAIDGRREDFVVTKDGVRLGRMDHLFKDMHAIRECQIVQREPGRIQIRIVRLPEYSPSDEARLVAECEKRMGARMDVELAYVSSIPRTPAGKFRAVINTMNEQQRYEN